LLLFFKKEELAYYIPQGCIVRKLADDLAWYTGRLRAILIVLIGVCWGMRKAAPARDVLVMLGQSGSAAAWGLFVSGIVWLGLNAWFWSRFALMRGGGAGTNMGRSRQRQRLLIRLWLRACLVSCRFWACRSPCLARRRKSRWACAA
jgi:hypothetical protein